MVSCKKKYPCCCGTMVSLRRLKALVSNLMIFLYLVSFLVAIIVHLFVFRRVYFFSLHTVTLDSNPSPISTVSERFIGFGIDTELIRDGVEQLRLDDPRLVHLVSLLGPSYVRLGGTASDRLKFTKTTPTSPTQLLIMTADTWDKINEFCITIGARLLFDFNVLLRDQKSGAWDAANAVELLEYTEGQTYADNIDWQLGNEPNSFRHVFNATVSPTQLAADFKTLKDILARLSPGSKLVGPDTTRPQPKRPDCVTYMRDFLAALKQPSEYLDAIAWHQYYLNGRTATLQDFWYPANLDVLGDQIQTMKRNIKKYLTGGLRMWLSETGSAYGGGAPGLSDTFAASPMWLDKLGATAAAGFETVIRQSLIGAHYCMITQRHDPTPDWWVTYLHRLLVGREVLQCGGDFTRYQRVYCHCAAKELGNSTVAMFVVNLSENPVKFALEGTAITQSMQVEEYILNTHPPCYSATDLYLNDIRLVYDTNEIPKLYPRYADKNSVQMPPRSLGFFLLHDVEMEACR